MSTKPESNYISSIHKQLPTSVYKEKMYNPLRRGTPDVWYSGNGGDVWIEYKYLPKLPKVIVATKLLTALQTLWLQARAHEGRNVRVIIGSPQGAVVLTADQLSSRLDPTDFVMSKKQVAEYICDQVNNRANSKSLSNSSESHVSDL